MAASSTSDQAPTPRLPASFASPCGPEELPCPGTAPSRKLLIGGAGVGLLATSAAVGIAAGFALPNLHFQQHGRPDPLVSSAGFGLGLAAGIGAAHLLVPLGAVLGNDSTYEVSVSEVRASAWRSSRWAALAGGVGVVLLGAGATAERLEFGAGQGTMAFGAATLFTSALVYAGLELAGVVRASQRARRPR